MGYQIIQLAFLLLILASSTCFSFNLPSEYSILGNDLNELLSEERVTELFKQWQEKHNKVYHHAQEFKMRLENFRWNLKYVIEKNSERKSPNSLTVGLNMFADLSSEEFREMYMSEVKMPYGKRMNNKRVNKKKRSSGSCDAPSSLDWRKKGVVTGVKNQGHCGSCWAFSSTGAMEGINAIVNGELISLSEQELVDCVTTNYGCGGGYMNNAFQWVVNNGGIDSESDYPYTAHAGTCNTTKVDENKVVTIDGYEDVEPEESALLCATVNQPISVGINASAPDFYLYKSGIYDGDCSDDPCKIDHAVLIVGYGSEDDEEYWIVKNSWGTDWGMEGYIYIRRGTNAKFGVCAINAMASYPTKESSSAPSPTPSPSTLMEY